MIFDSREKVELLADHFQDKLTECRLGKRATAQQVRGEVGGEATKGVLQLDPPITTEEVGLAAKDLPGKKAVGPDEIPAEIYKHCPEIHGMLAELFTGMLERNQIPSLLRRFYVVPLDKPGKDPNSCDGKRPIALLSPLMKLLEMILVRRMLPMLEETLSGGQYAYQQGRSTELLLGDLDAFVEDSMTRGWHTYMVGLDIQGAFDSASLVQLVRTLREYSIPAVLVRFIGTWLTRRSFRVKLGTLKGVIYSRPREPSRGVPQGGVLSPCFGFSM